MTLTPEQAKVVAALIADATAALKQQLDHAEGRRKEAERQYQLAMTVKNAQIDTLVKENAILRERSAGEIMTDEARAQRIMSELTVATMREPYHDIVEDIKTLTAAFRAVREECCKQACFLCERGFPLQENGCWHNDMDGKDCMVNNECRAAAIRKGGA